MRLKTIQIQLKPVRTIDLEFLIRTPRSVKLGLIIDESVQITESIPPRSVKIGLKQTNQYKSLTKKTSILLRL